MYISANIYYKYTETYSFEQALLELGMSAKFQSGEVKARHSGKTTRTRSVATSLLVQNCFTAFVDRPATFADLFSSEFTAEEFDEYRESIGVGNPPLFCSSITYGRFFLATISSDSKMSELFTALEASLNTANVGGQVEASEESLDIMRNAEITVTAIGAESSTIKHALENCNLHAFLDEEMTPISARPISYALRNISNGSYAALRDTTKYEITTCEIDTGPHPSRAVVRRAQKVRTAMSRFHGYMTEATNANDGDRQFREKRKGQAEVYYTASVEDIRNLVKDVSSFDDDSRAWLGGWARERRKDLKVRWQYFRTRSQTQRGWPFDQSMYDYAMSLTDHLDKVLTTLIQRISP